MAAGTHRIDLRCDGTRLGPGSRGEPFPLGPLAIARPAAEARLVTVPAANALSLCGKPFNWIEAVASS